MKIKITAFGIAKDILQNRETEFDVEENATVGEIKAQLIKSYPDFAKLNSLAIAVNEEYAEDNDPVRASDEIVIIPPVSGG